MAHKPGRKKKIKRKLGASPNGIGKIFLGNGLSKEKGKRFKVERKKKARLMNDLKKERQKKGLML